MKCTGRNLAFVLIQVLCAEEGVLDDNSAKREVGTRADSYGWLRV
jgi:hypothetical protein